MQIRNLRDRGADSDLDMAVEMVLRQQPTDTGNPMPTLFTDLPEMWALQPGEKPCPAAEAAAALLEIAAAASDDTEPCLAQLGAAPDVTPEVVALGVTLRNLLAQVLETADQLAAATGPQG